MSAILLINDIKEKLNESNDTLDNVRDQMKEQTEVSDRIQEVIRKFDKI